MRINTGLSVTVTATERWLSELRLGRAFGGYGAQAAVAGQFSHVQLLNPAASGITVLVFRVWVRSGAVMGSKLSHHDADLVNNNTTKRNLLSGAAAPVGLIRNAANVAQLGNLFLDGSMPASDTFRFADDWITELGPGEGVVAIGDTANQFLNAAFLWLEL